MTYGRMTNDRAIHLLESIAVDHPQDRYQEAINMAIESLKAPTGLISKQDVKWQIQEWINELNEAIDMLDSIPSVEPLVLTCDGCRHVGTYDTDFPCSGCIRREKDYYEQER